MKNVMIKLCSIMLIFVMVLTIMPVSFVNAEPEQTTIIDSGTCGEDAFWKLNNKGVLTISGNGVVKTNNSGGWDSDLVTSIVIESGITWLDNDVFEGCTNIYSITIPETVDGYFAEPTFCSYFPVNCLYRLYKNSSADYFIQSVNKEYIVKNITEIRTSDDLLNIADDLFGNYKLMNDIDMQGISFVEIGDDTGGAGSVAFNGIIDGNGYEIRNLVVNELNVNGQTGLVEFNQGTIKNLKLNNITLITNNNQFDSYDIGAFAGYNIGTIEGCACSNINVVFPKDEITSLRMGNISGANDGVITKCYSTDSCFVFNKLTSTEGGHVGGIVGYNNTNGIVEECLSKVTIQSDYFYIGGIAGDNLGIIKNCCNMSTILKTVANGRIAGGISAHCYDEAKIENCLSYGNYELIGNDGSSWPNCFYGISYEYSDSDAISNSFFLDYYSKVWCNDNNEKMTLAELMEEENLANFDFEEIWKFTKYDCNRVPLLQNVDLELCEGEHNFIYSETASTATCEINGTELKLCNDCGYVSTVIIPASGHQFDSGTIIENPGCETDGVVLYKCSKCTLEKTESINLLGHDYDLDWIIDKEATCTSTGIKSHHCTRCAAQRDVTVIAKTEHTYDDGCLTTAATPLQDGVKTYTCTVCKAAYTENIPYEGAIVSRIYGGNRFKTSYAIADELKAEHGVDKFSTVIIANGMNYPDALAGSYLAAKKNAPILMVNTNSSSSIKDLQSYIKNNVEPNGTIYILGGTNAVDDNVKNGLEGYSVIRLSGPNRYDTNLKILEEAGIGNEDILVCTGTGFADSLSGSATGLPILLVGNSLTDAQKTFLSSVKGNDFYIIGGTAAVSADIEKSISKYGKTERISGKSRFETSKALAEKFFPGAENVVVAYAHNFPDGLCGGPLAYKLNSPLILTGADMSKKPNASSEATAANVAISYVSDNQINKGIILGGSGVLSDNTARLVFGMDASEMIIDKKFK